MSRQRNPIDEIRSAAALYDQEVRYEFLHGGTWITARRKVNGSFIQEMEVGRVRNVRAVE